MDPRGPAAEAGVEPRNVVTALDGEGVDSTGDLLSRLREYSPGDVVEMTVASGGEAREVTIELGDRG